MTPQEFVQKWSPSTLRERQGSQEHFIDICRMLEEQTPAEADPTGKAYCFDAGAEKTIGRDGFADVWKKDHFAWEYKGKHRDLTQAYAQLQQYAPSLSNPPLLIVSDMDTIVIRTNFTYSIDIIHTIGLSDLLVTEKRQLLKWAFSDPEQLRPGLTRAQLTEKAAARFARVAQRLRDREYEPHRVAHFMNKMLFSMFAEDIGLLPAKVFTKLLELASRKPQIFEELAAKLFGAMKSGGLLGLEEIDWFNGGLFDDDDVIPLQKTEIDEVLEVSRLDWSSIEPSIFGTLFERGLDPDKRSQLGAHFTDPRSIMRIVDPVVLAPLRAEWEGVRQEIAGLMMQHREIMGKATVKSDVDLSKGLALTPEEVAALKAQHRRPAVAASASKLLHQARLRCQEFLLRLEDFRVLDPACGSGNFLYLSLLGLKDFEHQVITEAEALGLPKVFPAVGPRSVMGIEVNLYAAELARVTIWIGQLQWMLRHGWGLSREPILKPLDQIDCSDALLNPDGTEAHWPDANCIVTNPPFLGDKRILSELGEMYTMQLRQVYGDRLPASADFVTYWFQKAWEKVAAGKTDRAGLVATQSIRKGSNRTVLDVITTGGVIYNAWSDEPWVLDGAAVRVSIVCFGRDSDSATARRYLNDHAVANIYSDLNAQGLEETSGVDFTQARAISQNKRICFQGPVKVGPFEIPGDLARKWLMLPSNPNGRPNSDVVRPWANGKDITGRPKDTWIIDFGVDTKAGVAAFYQEPFEYVREHVKRRRDKNKDAWRREHWWLHGRSGEELRAAVKPFERYISTPRVAKHRFFVWLHCSVLPDSRLNVIARGDYTTFGILHSRFHIAWFLKTSSRHGVGNDPTYNARSVFETFPFPLGLTPDIPAADYASDPTARAIADAARRLDEMRERWLNPPELVRREPEVLPSYPDRTVPLSDKAITELKARTLTKLYNTRPAWLEDAHARLDDTVASAYNWPGDISNDEALRYLLQLNQERTQDESPVVGIEGTEDNDVEDEDAPGDESED